MARTRTRTPVNEMAQEPDPDLIDAQVAVSMQQAEVRLRESIRVYRAMIDAAIKRAPIAVRVDVLQSISDSYAKLLEQHVSFAPADAEAVATEVARPASSASSSPMPMPKKDASTSPPERPRVQEAIRAVLRGTNGAISMSDIVTGMEEMAPGTKRDAIHSGISKLVQRNEVEKTGDHPNSRYRLVRSNGVARQA